MNRDHLMPEDFDDKPLPEDASDDLVDDDRYFAKRHRFGGGDDGPGEPASVGETLFCLAICIAGCAVWGWALFALLERQP